MPKNHNPEDSYSENILFTSFTTGSQSVQHQLQLNASSPFILITSPKLPVSFNLPLYFNKQRGADGEGYVKRRYVTGRWSQQSRFTCIDKASARLTGYSVAAVIAAAFCVVLETPFAGALVSDIYI